MRRLLNINMPYSICWWSWHLIHTFLGHKAPYKTVYARAMQDSTVLKVPGQSFARAFEDSPESMLRVVQVIMLRLIRVTFWALHNYLGLDQQLMKPVSIINHRRVGYWMQPKCCVSPITSLYSSVPRIFFVFVFLSLNKIFHVILMKLNSFKKL